jgi:hypothetical protein
VGVEPLLDFQEFLYDVHYTSTSGSAVSFAFTRTSVSWLARRNAAAVLSRSMSTALTKVP